MEPLITRYVRSLQWWKENGRVPVFVQLVHCQNNNSSSLNCKFQVKNTRVHI